MGAACGCLKATGEKKTKAGTTINQGGVALGGNYAGANIDPEDQRAIRAARFEAQRKEEKHRGISKESQVALALKEKKIKEAEELQAQREGDVNMRWSK